MSLIGQMFVIKIHEDDSGVVVFDSVTITPFTHEAGAVTTTSVVKNDFTGSANDAYTVKFAYPNGSVPASSTTMATLLTNAQNAVNAQFGNGEAGAPT